MSVSLTKSYVRNYDAKEPYQKDRVLYSCFEEARKAGLVAEFVNLENGERMTTIQILDKSEEYAKGLLASGLTPGVDTLMVIACPTLQAVCLFAAAAAIGVSYAQPFVQTPREKSILLQADLTMPKVIICGEGGEGLSFTALVGMFEGDDERPSSTKMPYVEHLIYDNTYKSRSPAQKFIKTLDDLSELGKSVTDQQLQEAKQSVKPEFVLIHAFTSGSTGVPKCVSHAHMSYSFTYNEDKAYYPKAIITQNADSLTGLTFCRYGLACCYGKVVLAPDISSERAWTDLGQKLSKSVSEERVQWIFLQTACLNSLVADVQKTSNNFPSVEMVLLGSQVISPRFREEIRKCFKDSFQVMVYGMTEMKAIGENLLPPTSRIEEAVYYTAKNTEVRLVNGNDEIVDIGEDGEIQAKSDFCFKEYRHLPEKTREAITDDGFLRTGDNGVMNSDGGFIIRGRTVDCLRFKVMSKAEYPGPIENILSKHPDIAAALVVAARCNDFIGDEVTYCLRMVPGKTKPTEEELLEFCLQNGMNNTLQRPARIVYFDSFPYTANGRKFNRRAVKDQVGAMIAEDEEVGKSQWFKEMESSVMPSGAEAEKDSSQ